MFLGIVWSSAYDRSERVALAQGSIQNALGYDINFKGPRLLREGKGKRLYLPLEVKKGGTEFIAQPDIYSEGGKDSHGHEKRHVRPHIRHGIISDLYVSPVNFDPGERKSENDLNLEKGKKVQFGDYELTFTAFDVSSGMGQTDSTNISVGATIVASYKGKDPIELKPIINVGGEHQHSGPLSRVKLPGPAEAYVTLENVNAGSKTIHLDYQGPELGKEMDKKEALPEVIAEVSIKPGMTVLWLGTFLMLFGGGIAVFRRWEK